MGPARFWVGTKCRRLGIVLAIALTLALVACGGGTSGTPSPQPTATAAGPGAASPTGGADATAAPSPSPSATAVGSATPGDERQVRVYFLRDAKIATASRAIPATQRVATEAIEALLAGPTEAERAAGMTTAIPEGTRLLGVTIDAGLATVNLSREFESGDGSVSLAARLAQVVYTLTQFPTVEQVQFQLEGEPVDSFGDGVLLDHPVSRADYEDLTPAILVETPVVGDTVSPPLHVAGTANTFEATFMIEILDGAGNQVAEQVVTATAGSGTRGTFAVDIPFSVAKPGPGAVVAYELSAKDGSRINEVEIPVTLQP
ncbi:MAG: GerMN domain-containing protein [Sphaerobacter sp.]|nr:GerMN domain-containing protein [Sphaerobacter sp.]